MIARGWIAVFLLVAGAIGAISLPVLSGAEPPAPSPEVCVDAPEEVADYFVSLGPNLGKAIDAPLGGHEGDAERGARWAVSPQLGHCIACHEIPVLKQRIDPDEPATKRRYGYHGTVGPSLEGVAGRFTEGELRLLIVDARLVLPAAARPAFHSLDGLHDVASPCKGKPLLSAAQVEDIVAFLKTLK